MPITTQTDPKLAAQELKQMQINDYLKIESKEFEGCRWDKTDGEQKCPNIKAVMQRWNKIQMITRDDILLAKSLDEQKGVFTFYTVLMKELSAIGDFQSSQAIYTTLNCASISRLQKVLMDEPVSKILADHTILFDNSHKQKHLKETQSNSLAHGSVVPLMTTVLAPFVDADGMTAQNDASSEQLTQLERQKIKIRTAAIKNFENFKTSMLSTPASVATNHPLSPVMNETQAYNLSLAILPRTSVANPSPNAFANIVEINNMRTAIGYDKIVSAQTVFSNNDDIDAQFSNSAIVLPEISKIPKLRIKKY